jgi:GNAT superfamily N-acetyltransferase
MQVLADSGIPVPPPDRATLKRFRNIVADLGADFYVALLDDAIVALVHVTYARQLTHGPHARLDQLVVAHQFRRRGIGTALLAFVQQRARKRGCAGFSCTLPAHEAAAHHFLGKNGVQHGGTWLVKPLTGTE